MKVEFSKIISGTMNWGFWGKNLDQTKMILLMNHCLEHKITTFDHADIYGGHTTEEAFGKAFHASKIDRNQVQFISKCGIKSIADNRSNTIKHYDYSQKHIAWSVENSLRNLKTPYLDLLLLHRPSPLMQADEIAEIIEKLKAEGKILEFGVSNFTPSQTALIETKTKVNYNQIQFSATHFDALTDGSLDYMQRNKINAMSWNPLGTVFKSNDEKSLRVKKCIEELSQKYNSTPDVLLISWILKHPAGVIPVFGTTDLERIKNLSNVDKIDMDLEDWFSVWTAGLGNKVP